MDTAVQEETAVVVWERTPAAVIYGEPGNVDKLLDAIREEARKVPVDVSTDAGRKRCASTAHKVARLKVHFDGLGKELTADLKAQTKAVDAERKRIRDELDALKGEVRAPLTAWEEAEEERKAKLTRIVDEIKAMKILVDNVGAPYPADYLRGQLAQADNLVIDERMGEYQTIAEVELAETLRVLREAIPIREKAEAEESELAQLRAEKEARERAEREAAEEKARAEREEQIRREAEVEATRKAIEKVRAEREAEEAKKRAAEAEAKKRAEDEEHRGLVRMRIEDALAEHIGAGTANPAEMRSARQAAKLAAGAIIDGKIPHVKVEW